MAPLSQQARLEIRAYWSGLLSARRDEFPLTKAQLDAAVAATDDWIDANAVSYNLALPVAARNALTTTQKAELFSIVSDRRYGG